ncbi:hypothetical protein [uncultured Paraglaciecola sp.]|uniref:hypothetical protein n=1 Tax=uncultured Paraglaciecola sp. TaxID=1765024 RepID=UPI002627653C|nr:hypothetical protein [uncultured Paraglaciecola sp.]
MKEHSYFPRIFMIAVIALLSFIAAKLSPGYVHVITIVSYVWLCIMAIPLGIIAIFFIFIGLPSILENLFEFDDKAKRSRNPDVFFDDSAKKRR